MQTIKCSKMGSTASRPDAINLSGAYAKLSQTPQFRVCLISLIVLYYIIIAIPNCFRSRRR